jgi:hypothetical protein
MEPSTDQAGGGSTALRRWGPIAAIVAVVAVVAVVLVATGGDDDGGEEAVSGGGTDDTTEVTTQEGEIVYPFSFTDAEEAGMVDDIDWGDRCDTETGRAAVPYFFAPTCYAPFEGDNGGATDEGVTADAIKIVYYQGPDDDFIINYITDAIANDDTNADASATMRGLIEYYETYYETYGRKVELIDFTGTGVASDPVAARADAVKIAEDIKPFQVWGGPALTEAFGDELAARGIQCISCAGGSQEKFEERAPYTFGLGLTSTQSRTHNVEWLVKQVAGRNAEFAGNESFHDQERRFGYLYIESSEESATNAARYREALQEEGVELAEMVPYRLDPATLQETAANAIAKLKEAGVTSVIFAGDPIAPRDFTREATKQQYFPEWIVNISTLVDTNVFARTYDQEQWRHAFGLTALAARTPEEVPMFNVYRWFHGREPEAPDTIGVIFPQAALFYAGLQEAGPNLTHESFRDALFRNPPTQRAFTAPSLSYGDKGIWEGITEDYQGIDDVTTIWWDPDRTGKDELRNEGNGMWFFVDGGRRYLPGEWPDEDTKAFQTDDAVDVYEELPEEERVKDYEPLRS